MQTHAPVQVVMIEVLRAIFGFYESDLHTPVNRSQNAANASRVASLLRALGFRKVRRMRYLDDNGHPTTTSVWAL
jgi:hypothetical protein